MVPSNSHNSATSAHFSQAVSRSNELLSCCKTAWKIQQQRQPQPLDQPPPPIPVFRLAETTHGRPPTALMILEEGLTLLRAMEFGLKQLQVLVRRRGHTNDPTQEIAMLVQQLEQDTQELTDFCQQLLQTRRRSKQAQRHWEFVVQWFQQVANHYSTQLQSCLKVRGDVLTEQAQQRKKLLVDPKQKKKSLAAGGRRSASSTATPLFDSPLFTAQSNGGGHSTTSAARAAAAAAPHSMNNGYSQNGATTTNGYSGHSTSSAPTSSTSSYYGGGGSGGGGYGGGGYGGGGGGGYGSTGIVGGTGMRQRKAETVASTTMTMDYSMQQEEEEEEKVHQQIQQRKQQRETQQRLNEAQQAETTLGELGQLFGKMSSLISAQGEVLEKIEDDVEAAHADIMAGQEELTNLYSLKKGNRPLIIKTFLILNFLIIFMKAYRR
jgi:hypothetical protein